jgi:Zn-dependent protease
MQELLGVLNSLRTEELIAVSIIPVLFAITVHEVAHGWIAKHLGDPTAERLGRLTLNPFKHIDPIGTVVLPAMLLLLRAGFLFGWAKPVPVTWENLRRPKRDMVLVAVAGPASNFLMALIWGVIAKIGISLNGVSPWAGTPMLLMGLVGIYFNTLLLVFNLLPVPPLDGGRVAVGLLPGRLGWQLSRLEPYGFFILIGLLLAPRIIGIDILGAVIFPVISAVMALVVLFVGLA